MGGVVANQGRIRVSAKDFWHVVGWAFNCSVVYPKRWKYWKAWLGYMLDVLDADWEEREAEDREGGLASTQSSDMSQSMLQESMLVKYLADSNGRTTAVRRVVAAVFAAGSLDDLRSYPEVFQNETREAQEQNGQKRKRVDSIKPGFGGFGDINMDLFSSSPPTDQTFDSSQNSVEEDATTDPWMAYPESIFLRQRILVMVCQLTYQYQNQNHNRQANSPQLSRLSATLPETFIPFRDLYDMYTTHARSLPLPAFSLLFSPSSLSALPSEVLVSLSRLVLSRLTPACRMPVEDADGITQGVLERYILPSVATTSSMADNARVSILVECLFRLFLKTCMPAHTPALDDAVEKGVRRREKKGRIDRRRKSNVGEEEEGEWLAASAGRLRRLVEWVGSCSGE